MAQHSPIALDAVGPVPTFPGQAPYVNGEYLAKNPGWHAEESAWKANLILQMLERNGLAPKTICDFGCGTGDVLHNLQKSLDSRCVFCGYDISPQALHIATRSANERLRFALVGSAIHDRTCYDLMLVLDVLEHVENYFGMLRELKGRAQHAIFHIPLDLSAQTVFRPAALLKRREMYGHLHYFTKETALDALTCAGFQVLDYFYTPRSIDFGSEFGQIAMRLPRKLCFAIHRDFAARVLGGYSLMVLAR